MPVFQKTKMHKSQWSYNKKFQQPFIYRIEIVGLPEGFRFGELRGFLNGFLGVPCKVLNKPLDGTLNEERLYGPTAHVAFKSEEDRSKAVKRLAHKRWKGSAMFARAIGKPKTGLKKNSKVTKTNNITKEETKEVPETSSSPIEEVTEEIKFESAEELVSYIRKRLTPLCDIPYVEQVKMKKEEAIKAITTLCVALENSNPLLKDFFKKQSEIYGGTPVKVHDTKHLESDYDYYKSCCEFDIGKHILNDENTVGFRICGSDRVAPLGDDLKTIPKVLLPIVRTFEIFTRTIDKIYPVYSKRTSCKGYWKMLSFRTSPKTEQVMMTIHFSPQKMNSVQIQAVNQRVKLFYTSEEPAFELLTSLYMQSGTDNVCHLLGKEHIEESFGDIKFEIRPDSFYPENQWAHELTLNAIRDLSEECNDSVLIDITGRRGTIGLPLAKDFSSVHIIESSEQNRKDTEEIAKANEITNTKIVAGNINYFFSEAVKDVTKNNLCIFDITRSKLQEHGISMIKLASNVTKVIFLASKKNTYEKELSELVKSTSGVSDDETFTLTEVVPIDISPHTDDYELILVFERIKCVKDTKS